MKTVIDRIQNGDCIEELARMNAGSVDLAFADPPFNIGYDYDVYDDCRKAEDYIDWSRRWIEAVKGVLKPDGTFWLAIGDDFAAELKVLCTRELGLHCRSWVLWFYTFGVHCKNKFTRSHTHLFHFVKNPKKFTFNSLTVRVPSARELVYGDKRADPKGRVPDDTWMMTPILPPDVATRDGFILRPQDIPERFPPTSDTWFFSRVAGTFKERAGFHGCQMPEQLLGRIIRACSNEGDLVLDPFAGSGTTPAVAKKLGRRFIGFEVSEKYTAMIKRRLAAIKTGDPLDGPENAAKSAPRTRDGRRLARSGVCASTKPSQGPVIAKSKVARGQVAGANGELATTVANAFKAAHQGYSSDRVLADPELNERFLDNCRLRGVLGEAKDWNHLLLDVRKRGGMSRIDTSRRTMVRRSEMEPYIFASEIAWWKVSKDNRCSLDEILCNPKLAQHFDNIARAIAPGYSSLNYRWAALSIRKDEAKGDNLLDRFRLAPGSVPLFEHNRLPSSCGHYVLIASRHAFYVGYSFLLSSCRFFEEKRVLAALETTNLAFGNDGDIRIRYCKFDDKEPLRWARRKKLLLRFNRKSQTLNVSRSLKALNVSRPLTAA